MSTLISSPAPTSAQVLTALATASGDIAVNSQKITGLGAPLASTDSDTLGARDTAIAAALLTVSGGAIDLVALAEGFGAGLVENAGNTKQHIIFVVDSTGHTCTGAVHLATHAVGGKIYKMGIVEGGVVLGTGTSAAGGTGQARYTASWSPVALTPGKVYTLFAWETTSAKYCSFSNSTTQSYPPFFDGSNAWCIGHGAWMGWKKTSTVAAPTEPANVTTSGTSMGSSIMVPLMPVLT